MSDPYLAEECRTLEVQRDELRDWIRQYVLPALEKTADKGCCWVWGRTGAAHDEKCLVGQALAHLPEGVRLPKGE